MLLEAQVFPSEQRYFPPLLGILKSVHGKQLLLGYDEKREFQEKPSCRDYQSKGIP